MDNYEYQRTAIETESIAYLTLQGFGDANIAWANEHQALSSIASDLRNWIESGKTVEEYITINGYKPNDNSFFGCFQTLDNFNEREAEWLVNGFIPKGQICVLAGDGGTAKTSLWVNIAAAISSGKKCLLDPEDCKRKPALVAYFSGEDSTEVILKPALRKSGADERNIITLSHSADKDNMLSDFKIGSEIMDAFIRRFRPALCILDPIQAYIPPELNMGARNAMRDCLQTLATLGEETDTTFLIIAHTNKRKAASGRDRISDSADLWDISRSVLMTGMTDEDNVRYLSNEKNNYAQLADTILYRKTSASELEKVGTTYKRDREYQQDFQSNRAKHTVEDCRDEILHILEEHDGTIAMKELDYEISKLGFSTSTRKRAQTQLAKDENKIKYHCVGFGNEKRWYMKSTVPFNTDTEPFQL